MSTSVKILVPLTFIQPGYFILSFVIGLIAIDVESRFGLAPALMVASAALALPIASYVVRTANPRWVVIDRGASLMTLAYSRFGHNWQRNHDIGQFRAVYWSIFNGRFPKIDLRVRGPNEKDVRLFWLDYSGQRDRADIPAAIQEVMALLTLAGCEDITRHLQDRKAST